MPGHSSKASELILSKHFFALSLSTYDTKPYFYFSPLGSVFWTEGGQSNSWKERISPKEENRA